MRNDPAVTAILQTEEEERAQADVPDARLRLIFVCAHPAIDEKVRTSLMLQTVLGLPVDAIASAMMISPSALEQRLVRAKQKITDAGLRFEEPEARELPERLHYVPDATLIGSVVVENLANIWSDVTVRGDNERIVIGERVNVQDASVLHTDPGVPLTLGPDVCIGHKVMLHGCTIGAGSLVGMNAVLLDRTTIGKHSIVGAHTLIPEGRTFPDGVLILASPGKVVRAVTPEEKAWILGIADGYVRARTQEVRASWRLENRDRSHGH